MGFFKFGICMESKKKEHEKNCEGKSLRYVMNYTKGLDMREGSMEILIEKLVQEIENTQEGVKDETK